MSFDTRNEWSYPDNGMSSASPIAMQRWWDSNAARWRAFQSTPSALELLVDILDDEIDQDDDYLLDGVTVPLWARSW